MKVAVIADDALKEELLAQGLNDSVQVQWLSEPAASGRTDFFIDLLFTGSKERIDALKKLPPATVIINAVIANLAGLPANFIRINGWRTFLKRDIVEASCNNENTKAACENMFAAFGKKTEWVPDIPGFVSARVVSMVINEAYFTLEEGVSSKSEIDTAMKLGTNYPYGPFEWSEKIGLKNIHDLLALLAKTNSRYQPCALIKKAVEQ